MELRERIVNGEELRFKSYDERNIHVDDVEHRIAMFMRDGCWHHRHDVIQDATNFMDTDGQNNILVYIAIGNMKVRGQIVDMEGNGLDIYFRIIKQ